MDRRPELQRRPMTLWEQLSAPDPAIGDFLKIPNDDDRRCEEDRRPCTLMDAISRDSRGDSGAGMISWKPLRDRLRLRRAANACSTATRNRRAGEDDREESTDEAPAPASMSLMALLEQADGQWDDDDEEEEEEEEEEDNGASASNSGVAAGEDEEDGEGLDEGMVRACCVCLVRHKGAAFIPCGHTFCRLCSRELLLTRASCPLCNAFIHDILHIF